MLIKLLIIALVGVVCGLLGSYAGAENTSKLWRRLGVPLVLTTTAYLVLRNLWVLSLILIYLPLSQGYGVPCFSDSGSMLGRFWYNLLKKLNSTYKVYRTFNWEKKIQEKASVLTRGTIGLIVCLAGISIPIITKNWLICLLTSIGIILVYTCVSWRGWGNFELLGKELTFAEFYTYLAIGSSLTMSIIF